MPIRTISSLFSFPLLALLLVACGSRSDGDEPRNDATDAAPIHTGSSPANEPDESNDRLESSFDRLSLRKFQLHYDQWDPSLSDLFSKQNGISQLCWPAAMAAEIEYSRLHRKGPYSSLQAVGSGKQKNAASTRYFAELCDTDLEVGTTAIQGVQCIKKYFKNTAIAPRIAVHGVDAAFGPLGKLPPDVATPQGPVTFTSIMNAIEGGSTLIALVGYYSVDPVTGRFSRQSGHFISLTGFGHRDAWGDNKIQLKVMNPGLSPGNTAIGSGQTDQSVELKKLPKSSANPENIQYEIFGASFSGDMALRALVESVVIFQ